jgi:hypothetical protein
LNSWLTSAIIGVGASACADGDVHKEMEMTKQKPSHEINTRERVYELIRSGEKTPEDFGGMAVEANSVGVVYVIEVGKMEMYVRLNHNGGTTWVS